MSRVSLLRFISEVIQQEASKITEPKRSGLSLDQLGLKPHGGVQNIIQVYNQATPEEKDYWGKWYHNAKSDVEDLARQFNLPFPVVAGIVAVLSPGNKWSMNLLAAEKLLQGQTKINAYPRQVQRARKILETGDTTLVSGPKVTVFFNSLMNPKMVEKDMVLDGHAINIWRGEKVNLKGLSTPNSKERTQMVQDYQTASNELGVPVQAVQAVTWYIWKYTGKTPPVEAPTGVYDVSKFKNSQPANDVSLTEAKIIKPSNKDIQDALEHAAGTFDTELNPSDFTLNFLGNLTVDQLRNYDDVGAWLDLSPDDQDDYSSFRGNEWQQRSQQWLKTGIPPIIVVSTSDGTVIGDGRGRVNFAHMFSVKLPTWELKQNENLDEVNAIGAGLVVGAGMGDGTEDSKKLMWSGDEPLKESVTGPQMMFHVTPWSNWKSIKKQGLVPQLGERGLYADDDAGSEPRTYLFEDLLTLNDAMANWFLEKFDDVRWFAILKVQIPETMELFDDPEIAGSFYVTEPIPTQNIILIKKEDAGMEESVSFEEQAEHTSDRYMTLDELYGQYNTPDEDELLWEYVGYDEYQTQPYKVIQANPLELANTDRNKNFLDPKAMHKSDRVRVRAFEKIAEELSRRTIIVVHGVDIVDGFHRTAAMSNKGVSTVRALDLSQPKHESQ